MGSREYYFEVLILSNLDIEKGNFICKIYFYSPFNMSVQSIKDLVFAMICFV
jgi:hypothetical protein